MEKRESTRQIRAFESDADALDELARTRGVSIAVIIREVVDSKYPGLRDLVATKRNEFVKSVEQIAQDADLDPESVASTDRRDDERIPA